MVAQGALWSVPLSSLRSRYLHYIIMVYGYSSPYIYYVAVTDGWWYS